MVKNSLFFQSNCSFDFGKKILSLSILIWLEGRQIYPSIALQPKYKNNNRNKKNSYGLKHLVLVPIIKTHEVWVANEGTKTCRRNDIDHSNNSHTQINVG